MTSNQGLKVELNTEYSTAHGMVVAVKGQFVAGSIKYEAYGLIVNGKVISTLYSEQMILTKLAQLLNNNK